MLLETRLDDGSKLFIDAATSGGFAKDSNLGDFHPDDALKNVVSVAAAVGKKLAGAAQDAARSQPAPETLELTFGIKVDASAVVSVSKNPEDGQFRITARWAAP